MPPEAELTEEARDGGSEARDGGSEAREGGAEAREGGSEAREDGAEDGAEEAREDGAEEVLEGGAEAHEDGVGTDSISQPGVPGIDENDMRFIVDEGPHFWGTDWLWIETRRARPLRGTTI